MDARNAEKDSVKHLLRSIALCLALVGMPFVHTEALAADKPSRERTNSAANDGPGAAIVPQQAGGRDDRQPDDSDAFGMAPTACDMNADCDDGLFCSGTEECVAGECQPGGDACAAGELCDEDADVCIVPGCVTDADCDDGDICNGGELCVGGICRVGIDYCDDGVF